MTSKNPQRYDLSRRKVLGGLSAVGLASVGAGLGTSAYFSDEETFKNNVLTAGSLDLKVDWEEHYSDWSDDEMVTVENDNGGMDAVRMEAPPSGDEANWIGVPDPQNPMLYVYRDALDEFMANTAIEAFPDDGDNGSQSLHRYSPQNYCNVLADSPDDLDPNRDNPARTLNDDTVDQNGDPKPLISLEDVKPGDFGELTLSFHLCDNPGYVWLNGQLVSASENGVTEPESKDADEMPNKVELLDQIQTLLWYDEDGDNVYEPGGETGQADVMIVIDTSGSMSSSDVTAEKNAANTLIDELGAGAHVGVSSFASDATVHQGLTGDKSAATASVNNDVPDSPGGSTDHGEAIARAQDELETGGRSGAQKLMVILTDGGTNDPDGLDGPQDADASTEAQQARDAGTTIYAVGFGGVNQSTLDDFATDPDEQHAYLASEVDELEAIFSQIAQVISGEECFFRGSMRELLQVLNSGNGIPLDGDRATAFDEVPGYGPEGDDVPSDPVSDARECFVPSTNNFIGLAWWLPVDHGNEAQTDSIAFDLGFYAEQCRHNNGAGMDLLTPTRRGSGWAKIEESFNGTTQDSSSFARARFGDNLDSGAWEAAVGNETGDATEANYVWTSGETVSWTYTYSANDDRGRFILGNDVDIEYTGLAEQPDGRVAIQTKANESTISVENIEMVVNGGEVELSGPNSVTASNDGDGRALEYLVINSDLDGESNFTVSGDVTVTLQGDFPGGDEDVAMDVVLE